MSRGIQRSKSGPLARLLLRRRIRRLPRYGLMATMPSRAASLAATLPTMLPQVERLFVFLDGFETVPDLLAREPKVTILRSQEHGAHLHCSGRLLPVTFDLPPFVAVVFDDDIHYPPDYAARLVELLARREGRALAGVHGERFESRDVDLENGRRCLHFQKALNRDRKVHVLGIGTTAFLSEVFPVDPHSFAATNMDDLSVSLAAERLGLPRYAVHRKAYWLRAYAQEQPDSIYVNELRDPVRRNAARRELMEMILG